MGLRSSNKNENASTRPITFITATTNKLITKNNSCGKPPCLGPMDNNVVLYNSIGLLELLSLNSLTHIITAIDEIQDVFRSFNHASEVRPIIGSTLIKLRTKRSNIFNVHYWFEKIIRNWSFGET